MEKILMTLLLGTLAAGRGKAAASASNLKDDGGWPTGLDQDGYGHARLAAADGTPIQLDFLFLFNGGVDSSIGNLYINVGGPAGAVRAVLLEKAGQPVPADPGVSPELTLSTDTYDLTQEPDGHFSVNAPGERSLAASYSTGGRDGIAYTDRWEEIAVVKDGTWLKDPVSGSSNFRFSWRQALGMQ